jgi:hypothetical protein
VTIIVKGPRQLSKNGSNPGFGQVIQTSSDRISPEVRNLVVPPICRNEIISPEEESSSDCSDLGTKSEDVRVDECVESKACLVHETADLPVVKEAT